MSGKLNASDQSDRLTAYMLCFLMYHGTFVVHINQRMDATKRIISPASQLIKMQANNTNF